MAPHFKIRFREFIAVVGITCTSIGHFIEDFREFISVSGDHLYLLGFMETDIS